MRKPLIHPIHLWAVRDALARPFESLLTAAALGLTIMIVGTSLLVPHAVSATVNAIMKDAPSIIVRKINAVGWQPLPADPAVAAASRVPGVVRAKPRVWGVVNGPEGPLTVVGIRPQDGEALPGIGPEQTPLAGMAVLGPGVRADGFDNSILLSGSTAKRFEISGRLPRTSGMVTQDLVLLSMGDARQLLGIPAGFASDLAVDVFHPEEESAILPDLSKAFPWPVRLIPRLQSIGLYSGDYSRRSAIAMIAAIPSILAVCLLVAVNIRKSVDQKRELAVLKSVGWTTGDIVRLLGYRVLFIGIPAAALGMAAAFLLVFGPLNQWIGTLFLGWSTPPPALNLEPEGAVVVLLEVVGCVMIPFLGSALSPALTGAAHDVQELLEGAEG